MSQTEDIPLRPRARTFTPLRVALGCVLLLAVGFIGGVEVQKRSGAGTGSAPAAAARGFTGRFAGGGAQAPGGGNATVGQVANVHGRTLYVTASDGTTKKVRTNANTKVIRSAVSHVGSIHPGDTVIVQGASRSNGTVKASRVTATAADAGGGGFGGFGG